MPEIAVAISLQVHRGGNCASPRLLPDRMKVMPDKMCKPVWTRQQPRWISEDSSYTCHEVRADVDGLLMSSYFVMLTLFSKDATGKKNTEKCGSLCLQVSGDQAAV